MVTGLITTSGSASFAVVTKFYVTLVLFTSMMSTIILLCLCAGPLNSEEHSEETTGQATRGPCVLGELRNTDQPGCTELICHWVSSTNRPQAQKCLSNTVSLGQLPDDSHTCVIRELERY